MSARVTCSARRRFAAALLALPVAAGVSLLSSVGTASEADAGRIKVSDTNVTSTSEDVTVSVQLGVAEYGELGVTAPGHSKPVKVDSGTGPKKLTYTLSQSSTDPAANGTYKINFGSKVLILGSGEDSSFKIAAPPAKPSGVSATAPTAGHVKVRWTRGHEPDLSSYTVSAGGASKVLSVGKACVSDNCSAVVDTSSSGSTPVSVRATRDGYGSPMSSSSANTSVRMPAAKTGDYGDVPGSGTGSGTGGSSGFPSPDLSAGGTGGAGGPSGGFPPNMPGGAVPSGSPYPSFGTPPEVAPAAKKTGVAAKREPALRPLSYGTTTGDTAVPIAIGLVLVLVGAHMWRLSRAGRLRPVLVGVYKAAHRRRR